MLLLCFVDSCVDSCVDSLIDTGAGKVRRPDQLWINASLTIVGEYRLIQAHAISLLIGVSNSRERR